MRLPQVATKHGNGRSGVTLFWFPWMTLKNGGVLTLW